MLISPWPLVFLLQLITISRDVYSLSMPPPPPTTTLSDRRDFIIRGAGVTTMLPYLSNPLPAQAQADINNNDIASFLNAKTISWDGPSWSKTRYGTSTLNDNAPPPSNNAAHYPNWLEGYHSINYKFAGASFPQGRTILSLRTAGAGLGTCLSLPNVGYNPPAVHALHFINGNTDSSNDDDGVYEDLAYNVPRRFEAFWPQAKVISVQTNGGIQDQDGSTKNRVLLSPKCLVTGDGCSPDVSPTLHSPASRIAMEFDGPTRRGGRVTQSSDVTMLAHSSQFNDANNYYYTAKSYSQYNIDQELQTFYKEISSYQRMADGVTIGKIRVAAFLPRYVKEMDAGGGDGAAYDYDENEAVAIYDYKFFMKGIDSTDAVGL